MFSLFRKPIFSFSLFPRVIDGCLPFILYIIYYIQDYFLYYILVCLSKVFQRTIFSFVLPFQRESVCKGKAFFRNLQIFSKVFFRKNFRKVLRRRAAYPFSLPCTSQGKILGAAVSTISRSLSSASLSSSAALPLESGCKGTDFFRFRNFYTILFCRIFSGYCLTR